MQAGLELFYWHRPENEDGYEWVSGTAMRGLQPVNHRVEVETRFLDVKRSANPRFVRYNPLIAEPLLFREFVDSTPTEEGFIAFANRFGDLGVGVLISRDSDRRPDGSVVSNLTAHDPFCRWAEARHKMREIVDVLTAIQTKDVGTLRKWFTIKNDAASYERRDAVYHHWSWVTVAKQDRQYLWDWMMEADSDDDAILRLAQGFAQKEINGAVSRDTDEAGSSIRVVFDADAKRMVLRICPDGLLGAMWLQCARVLTLNPTFKSCESCGKWFELSPDAKRKQAKYCSSRCKVAAYRAKKAAATLTSETSQPSGQ